MNDFISNNGVTSKLGEASKGLSFRASVARPGIHFQNAPFCKWVPDQVRDDMENRVFIRGFSLVRSEFLGDELTMVMLSRASGKESRKNKILRYRSE
ncbi:MAG: hypothetical protein JW902_09410 [Syntrophaceae bacterium]|nr:hypothetical protein [Syntrophaceae bacterium]